MFCNKCGAIVDDDAKFCTKCGQALDVPAPKAKSKSATAVPVAQKEGTQANEITQKIQAKKMASTTPAEAKIVYSQKSQIITIILALIFGGLGVHNFYVKKLGKAWGQLIITMAGVIFYLIAYYFVHSHVIACVMEILLIAMFVIVGIWAFVDFLKAVDGTYTDRQGLLLRPPVFHVKADK